LYPGKSNEKLKVKRNRLLRKLLDNGVLNQEDYELAMLEEVPDRPQYQPQKAIHFMRWLEEIQGKQGVFKSMIDSEIQNRLNRLVDGYGAQFKSNDVGNIGVVVLDTWEKKIVGYVGNTKGDGGFSFVDVCRAPRSSGSVLKPLLYAQMISNGELAPNSLIHDLPINYNGFIPKNYSKQYEGLVPVSKALIQSLNAPAVEVLHDLGIRPFYDQLQQLGFSTLNFEPSHYGLTLILGGGEITLLDLVGVYGALNVRQKKLESSNFKLAEAVTWNKEYGNYEGISPWAWRKTLDMMQELERPAQEWGWEWFQGKEKVAWKTGTSFGHRDAWAIGTTDRYVVGVWVGNQEGDGRPGLTGVNYAAPIMFRVFEGLESDKVTNQNEDRFKITLCSKSGYKATKHCIEKVVYSGGESILQLPLCTFHQVFVLDSTESYRIKKDCYFGKTTTSKPYFSLSPFELYYYKRSALDYEQPPEFIEGCQSQRAQFKLVYPKNGSAIFLPVDIEGEQQEVILEAVAEEGDELYWHLGDDFITATKKEHKVKLDLSPGSYSLYLLNQNGVRKKYEFEIRSSSD
jgi:penicillin-binding protein 1C